MSLLRRLRGHKSYDKKQGPDHLMRAKCTCGALFEDSDDRFGLAAFQRWEREHVAPGEEG